MRRFIILLTITIIFLRCTVKEKPVFLTVENIEVVESNAKVITLSGDALFINPNDIGGELKTDEIKIFVNDNEIGYVSAESFKVPVKKEFSIPITSSVPIDSLLSNKSLGGLIGSLFSKQVKVQYKGDIIYKTFGFSYRYHIDETENVNIKF